MNRKLILLNVALVLVVAYAGYLMRNEVKAARVRAAVMRNVPVNATQPPPLVPLADQSLVVAARYQEIPIKTLFHPSRDSNIPVPVRPSPPLPPPMPPLPKYRGTMNIDGGPMALLAIGNGPSQEVRPGEMIGPFKLVDFNTVDMTLEWQGEIARRTLDQLTDRTITASAGNGDGVRSVAPVVVTAPAATGPLGPGQKFPNGGAACQANDTMPFGTVLQGLRKVQVATPFERACLWEALGR